MILDTFCNIYGKNFHVPVTKATVRAFESNFGLEPSKPTI